MVFEPENLKENETSQSQDAVSANNQVAQSANEIDVNHPVGKDSEEISSDYSCEEGNGETHDYSGLSKEELVATIKLFAQSSDVLGQKGNAEEVKNQFYKIHRAEIAEKKQAFVESGGQAEDFSFEDSAENEFKEYYKQFRDRKASLIDTIERDKKNNLAKKKEIIAEIDHLINKEEAINDTFKDFRDLQERWKHIGAVPQSEIKTIWESYHLVVGKFYDYIKINKELRDLDLKKNLEQKMILCEHAERLLLEESVVKAFGDLQKLHEVWREIGPAPQESKEEVWERFKLATSTINKRHQDYFVLLKDQEKRNLDAKKAICEKIKELIDGQYDNPRAWTDASNQVVEMQKVWRTVGFAPKKFNNEIYAEFRTLCDEFFEIKKKFFDTLKSGEEDNKQQRIDLCIQAEALSSSKDWKETTEILIKLQKEWKSIGNVTRKDSEKLWKRFRGACDTFFAAKDEYFKSLDSEQEQNLQKKHELVARLTAFQLTGDHEADLKVLMDIQKEWSDVGFVPLKEKNKLQAQYRELLNEKFSLLNIDTDKSKNVKYHVKLESYKLAKNPKEKFTSEKVKIQGRIKQLQTDIITLQNNMGFFSKSNNASSFIKDVEAKIKKGQEEIQQLKEQLKLISDVEA